VFPDHVIVIELDPAKSERSAVLTNNKQYPCRRQVLKNIMYIQATAISNVGERAIKICEQLIRIRGHNGSR